MPMFNYTETIAMVTENCCTCGIIFGMTTYYQQERRTKGEYFYCPNGHPQKYTYAIVPELERKLAQERSRHDQTRAALRDKEAALKAESERLERLNKRVKNGVCPCCKRTFQNLSRHMKTKHAGK